MFDIGGNELMIILVVALLVLGPTRLPDVATGIARALREFRKAARDITAQLEIDESVAKPFHELRSALQDLPASLPRINAPEHAPVPVGGNAAAEPPHDALGHPIEPQPVPVPQPVAASTPIAPVSAPAGPTKV